ncbi:uncharacterized protein JCM10292_001360 [Rhodotorula paludigena]|uniref:uncharacterized protein n=1 Tax=Rhodotorula paludigena TaxID=86838 RepID=UPI003175C69B
MPSPPMLYGTAWKGHRTAALVEQAIRAGFRGIDTACQPKHYHQPGVGDALVAVTQDGTVSRKDLWIQTKYTPIGGQDLNKPLPLATSLRELKTDYLDALVLHSPLQTKREHREVWTAFENAVDDGKVRHLGISNIYDATYLAWIFETARIKPSIVQNRFYADVDYAADILPLCAQQGADLQTFWTLTGNPQLLAHPSLAALARAYESPSLSPAFALYEFLMRSASLAPGERGRVVPLDGTTDEDRMRLAVEVVRKVEERKDLKTCEMDEAGPSGGHRAPSAPPQPAAAPPARRIRHGALGPATDVLTPAQYAQHVEQALEKAQQKVQEIKGTWERMGAEESSRTKGRCSVSDLLDEASKLYDDPWTRPDLQQWVESRWIPSAPNRKKGEHDVDDDGAEDGAEPDVGSPVPLDKVVGAKLPDQPDLQTVLDEAVGTGLNLYKAPQVRPFARKTRLFDYNALFALRPTTRDAPPPSPADPLAHLVYTITFHSLPGPKTGHTQARSARQVLKCLGSTTLQQLRDELTIASETVPAEDALARNGEDSTAGDSADENEEAEDDTAPRRVAMTGTFGGGQGEEETEHVRWLDEPMRSGAAFVAEGQVYGANEEGVLDYADWIIESVDELKWSETAVEAVKNDADTGADAAPEDLLVDPALLAAGAANTAMAADDGALPAASAAAPQRPTRHVKPALQKGAPIQDAKLGAIPLRIGQPYLFVQQGNAEHVWTVDEVRYLHPSDPDPFPPQGINPRSNAYKHFRCPYPITTFLSRTASQPKCRLCDRDPGVLHVLEDELAGETPAVLCRTCFEALHPVPKEVRRKRAAAEEARAAEEAKKVKGKGKAKAKGKAVEEPKDMQQMAEPVPDDEREGLEGVQVVPLLAGS